jgi:acetyltransferase-like isoleucine patch superfamily enzyme
MVYEFCLWLANNVLNQLPSHTIRRLFYTHVMRFDLGLNSSIHLGCRFDAIGNLVLGAGSVLNRGVRIDNRAKVTIGCNVSISEDAIILTAHHDLDDTDFAGHTKPITIGSRAFIGTRAIILPGCHIGSNAALGAGAVLTKPLPATEIWVGSPAKQIRHRPKTLRYQLNYNRLFH